MDSSNVPPSPASDFRGEIEPTRTPIIYQAGLAVVAFAMVLLPLVYVALIILVGKLVWWHITNDAAIFEHVRGRAIILALLLYVGPAIVGGIFILFLIKPLFSRRPKSGPSFKLLPENEPQLFAFVGHICDLIGAPRPREVHLDSRVNASAGFRRGWLSFFGNDLVLTIGMPLAAGMSMRQVAGVLAHEFGHFAQGAGMRFCYIIRTVNAWFARVVFERDAWDEKLDAWAKIDDWRIQIIFKVAQGGVWLGRRVLWGLMYAGHAISCFMSRQMEFDADSYEAKIAGSSEFPRTSERLRLLGVAQNAAIGDAQSTFQHHELPDDLSALVVWRANVMPDEVRNRVNGAAVEAKTGWLDTHPADADRVKAAAALAAPGVFQREDPAADLFSDFPALSRAVTLHFYEHEQKLALEKMRFRTSEQMIADRQSADDAEKHLAAFYGELFEVLRVPPLPDELPTLAPSAAAMKERAAAYEGQLRRFQQLNQTLYQQSVGCDLLSAKFSFQDPDEFQLDSNDAASARTAVGRTAQLITGIETEMSGFEQAVAQRLSAGLAWIEARNDADAVQREKRHALVDGQRRLARNLREIGVILRARGALQLIFANARNNAYGQTLETTAKQIARRIESAFQQVLTRLGDASHPYLPTGGTIRDSLYRDEPGEHEFAHAFRTANVCADGLLPLLTRIMGDLCGIVLQAEKQFAESAPDSGPSA